MAGLKDDCKQAWGLEARKCSLSQLETLATSAATKVMPPSKKLLTCRFQAQQGDAHLALSGP